jgi:hypothetical protein
MPCSLGLSATSQQYFSLRKNQPPATSRNQPAVLFSQNKPAPAISHQPTEQAEKKGGSVAQHPGGSGTNAIRVSKLCAGRGACPKNAATQGHLKKR